MQLGCDWDTSLEATEGSSIREVSFREVSSIDSSLIRLLSSGSSDSVASSRLAESIVSSLESSVRETFPPVVSKAERVLSSAKAVESSREGSLLVATLLSKSPEALASELRSSAKDDVSKLELTSVLDGVVSAECSLNCDESFQLLALVALSTVC